MSRPANEDMVQGYLDGHDPDAPEPSANRSASYRHGFTNGRDELTNKRPRASYWTLVRLADEAMAEDDARQS